MIEDYDNDDKWRMVEDEFFTTARLFTAHLHLAEYNRLKKEAAKREPGQRFIPRLMPKAEHSAKYGSPSKKDEVDPNEDDEDPFMKNDTLASLMNGSQNSVAPDSLIVRRAPATLPPDPVYIPRSKGWTGGAKPLKKEVEREPPSENETEDEMDLDEIPLVRRNQDVSKSAKRRMPSQHKDVEDRPLKDMFIGRGVTDIKVSRSAPQDSKALESLKRTTTMRHEEQEQSDGSIQATRKGATNSKTNKHSHPLPRAMQPPSRPESSALGLEDDMDFGLRKRPVQLSARALARLEKRKGREASDSKATEAVEMPVFYF